MEGLELYTSGTTISSCDVCRRRKVKCDGTQPCQRCSKAGAICTYGSSSNRLSTMAYARELEQKVEQLRAQLEAMKQQPGPSLPQQSSSSGQGYQTVDMGEVQFGTPRMVEMLVGPGDDYVYRIPYSSRNSNVFYGRFAGFAVLHTLGDMCSRYTGIADFGNLSQELVLCLEPFSLEAYRPSRPDGSIHTLLPPKEKVLMTKGNIQQRVAGHDYLDQTGFATHLDRLYEIEPEDFTYEDFKFLALVFAVLALGRRFSPMSAVDEVNETDWLVRLKGANYFFASRGLLEKYGADDLDSIRAMMLQAQYLMASSMVSIAHSCICAAISAAMRIGLHVSDTRSTEGFNPSQSYERRSVFAALNMMETYMSSVLGIPKLLRRADCEALRIPVYPPSGPDGIELAGDDAPRLTENTLLQNLYHILAEVVTDRQLPQNIQDTQASHYEIKSEILEARELDLHQWHESLSMLPVHSTDQRTLFGQLSLRLSYAAVQCTLYRPFLHHLARSSEDENFDVQGYRCGSECVKAAMQAIWLIQTLHNHALLHEAHWVVVYLLNYAGCILVFFVAASKQRTTVDESTAAANKARDLLVWLGTYSLSARKSAIILDRMLRAAEMVTQK